MRKVLMLTLMLTLMISIIGVAGAQEDYEGVDPTGAEVLYWHQYNDGAQLETINALIEEFNSTNEYGITVTGVPQGGYNEIRDLMNVSIISGELPNLVAGYQNDAASYYLDDAAADLNPLLNSEAWGFGDELENLNQGILAVNVFEDYDGAMLAWPNQVSANVMAVNLSMMTELGFDGPPTSFEAFKEVACAAANASNILGVDDVQGYPIKGDASNYESFLASMGGRMFVDGRYTFTDEASIATFEFYKDLYDSGCAYIPESRFGNTDDFAIGLNPMALGSSAGLPFILGAMESSGYDVDWTVTTTPYTEGNQTIQIFVPSIIMVPSTPEEDVAAWLFLKFLASAENQAAWTEATSYFPINLEASANLGDFEASNPLFAEVNRLVADPSVNVYSSPQQLSYGAIRDLVNNAVIRVTSGGEDVATVAQELEDEANAIHEESN